MIRKIWFGKLLIVFVVLFVFLLFGCRGKDKDRTEEETVEAVPKKAAAEKRNMIEMRESKGLKMAKLQTSMGDIVIELNEKAAPVTVKNFLSYIEEGFYDGLIFHRVMPDFMIQGGGFTPDMAQKKTREAIVNEAANGLKNDRGTIAMARTPHPHSATSQFFINLKDNDFLNFAGHSNPGYAVFGRVAEGMEVVDEIAAVKTTQKGPHADVPVQPVVIKSAKVVSGI